MPFPASRNISWLRKCRIPDHPSAFAPVDVCFRLLPDVGDTEADDSGPFRVRECPLHAVSRPGVFSGSRLPRSPYGFIHTALRVQEADFLLNFAAHLESS